MKPYRVMKRPIEVRAMYWDGRRQSSSAVIDWVLSQGGTAGLVCDSPDECKPDGPEVPHHIQVLTSEGVMKAHPSWWIIQGIEGEFYPCKPSVFDQSYEFLDQASGPH